MKIAVATLGERFDDRDVIKSFASVATHLLKLEELSTKAENEHTSKSAANDSTSSDDSDA